MPPETSLEERAAGHLKNAFRNELQLEHLRRILRRTRMFGQKFLLVLPPLRADFRIYFPSKLVLYRSLRQILGEFEDGIPVLDLSDSPEFQDTDFGDMDHLNPKGAAKCAAIVRRFFKDLDKGGGVVK